MKEDPEQSARKFLGFVIDRFVQRKKTKVRHVVAEYQTVIDDTCHAEWNATQRGLQLRQAV